MTKIHSTSIVAPTAQIDESVEIGPFCTVGANVKIGAGCRLISHCVIDGYTTIGKNNTFFPFAAIGLVSQHLRSHIEDGQLIIGDNNLFRENTTAHCGTEIDDKITRVGNDCAFLAGAHIAHDCKLGSGIVMSNNVLLAGHVHVGDKAIIGGGSAVLQFTHIGKGAMIGGMAGIARDVIPYGLVMGRIRGGLDGLNLVGLQRAGVPKEQIFSLQKAYKILFNKEDGHFADRIAALENNIELMRNPLVQEVVAFVKNPSKNNILQPED